MTLEVGSERSMGLDATPIPLVSTVTTEALRAKVFIGLPWQKSTNPLTSFCISAITDRRRSALSIVHGDAYVCHSRNRLVNAFLKTAFEWMLMIDDDMVIPMGDANWYNANTGLNLHPKFAGLNSLNRLLSHNKTLVGGLYFGRQLYGRPMYAEGANSDEEANFARRAPHELVKPTRWVATGCLLTHRTVFEDIEKKFPRLSREQNRGEGQWFTPSEAGALELIRKVKEMLSDGPMTGEKSYKALQMLSEGEAFAKSESSLGMGEDVTLCRRAALCGHPAYVDMALVCGHLGACCYGPNNTQNLPKK